MLKVTFTSTAYWNHDEFWQDIERSGLTPTSVRARKGLVSFTSLARETLTKGFAPRVAGWVYSPDKSVSVFIAALPERKRRQAALVLKRAALKALEVVGRHFTARTGAQGKVRLRAEPSFVVAVHPEAKNGSPQWHVHIAVRPRVEVPGQAKTYATHTRELYSLRRLFSAVVNHELAHGLAREFGVRVEEAKHGVRLPDVPRPLCRLSSVRERQIEAYLAKESLTPTPVARRYAAYATRRLNRDKQAGRAAFARDAASFQAESICFPVTQQQKNVHGATAVSEVRRVRKLARQLVRERGAFGETELLARAVERAAVSTPAIRAVYAAEAVLKTYLAHGLKQGAPKQGQDQYTAHDPLTATKNVIRRHVEYVFGLSDEPRPPKSQAQSGPDPARRNGGGDSTGGSRETRPPERPRPKASERSTDTRRLVEKVFESCRVVGAVGQTGLRAVQLIHELWTAYRRPIWRADGQGDRRTPGSVAEMARDLKKTPRLESHRTALSAMARLNAKSLEHRLRYGQAVYRGCRRPKCRLKRNMVVSISNATAAKPRDLAFILKKARRAGAKVIVSDSQPSRLALYEWARSMKPGQLRRQFPPEQSR